MRLSTAVRAGGIAAGSLLASSAVLLVGVFGAQLAATRRRVLVDPRTAPDLGGVLGSGGSLVRLLVLGDSTAVGVGITDAADSVPGRVAAALVRRGWSVDTTSVAVAGSRAADVRMQISRALVTSEQQPHDVALILVGGIDATGWTPISEITRSTTRAVVALRNAGVHVVVGTCLDLGASRCTGFPLRDLWCLRSRRVSTAQTAAAEAAGAHVVNLFERLGPIFRADAGALSTDGFHPSADGYRLIAEALIPPAIAACEESSKSRA